MSWNGSVDPDEEDKKASKKKTSKKKTTHSSSAWHGSGGDDHAPSKPCANPECGSMAHMCCPCKGAWYCNAACQKAHWAAHKRSDAHEAYDLKTKITKAAKSKKKTAGTM